jgi:DNA-binding CsgD family transcriptional regulator
VATGRGVIIVPSPVLPTEQGCGEDPHILAAVCTDYLALLRAFSGKEPTMAQIDIEILTPFAARFLEGTNLTPAERAEVLRIAQGFACKDSASAAGVSPETIRARRKRIYRKLDVPGSGELLASLLSLSLKMLAKGERIEPRQVVPQGQPRADQPTVTVASR